MVSPRKAERAATKPKRPARRVALKFRLEPERAAIVERIAKKEGKTESEVLREGVDLLERIRARREHLAKLADFIRDIPAEHRPLK